MLKKSLLAVSLISMMLLSQCLEGNCSGNRITGSGNLVTVTSDLKNFDALEISNAFTVTVSQGESFEVTVKVDDNIKPLLHVEKRGNTLHLYMESGHSYDRTTLKANITMPDIKSLGLSGASSVNISGFEFKHPMKYHLSGASNVDGSMQTGDIEFHLSGASNISIVGSGARLSVHASGASDIDLADFPVEKADLSLSGATGAKVNVREEINAEISGASRIKYRGRPRLGSISTSGASTIKGID